MELLTDLRCHRGHGHNKALREYLLKIVSCYTIGGFWFTVKLKTASFLFFISHNSLFIFFPLMSPIFHVCLDLIFNVIYIHTSTEK